MLYLDDDDNFVSICNGYFEKMCESHPTHRYYVLDVEDVIGDDPRECFVDCYYVIGDNQSCWPLENEKRIRKFNLRKEAEAIATELNCIEESKHKFVRNEDIPEVDINNYRYNMIEEPIHYFYDDELVESTIYFIYDNVNDKRLAWLYPSEFEAKAACDALNGVLFCNNPQKFAESMALPEWFVKKLKK